MLPSYVPAGVLVLSMAALLARPEWALQVDARQRRRAAPRCGGVGVRVGLFDNFGKSTDAKRDAEFKRQQVREEATGTAA